MKTKIEILLPIYNEVSNLAPLVRELDRVVSHLRHEAEFHYLFVNDGSTDGSAELLHALAKQRSDVRTIDLIHNFGHAAALVCGIDHFHGDALAIMDADLQDSPDAILQMYEAWKKGARTVVAERGQRQEKNKFLFQAFYYLLHRMAPRMPPMNFGTFSLLDRTVVERLKSLPERNRYLPGLVAYSSGPISCVKVDRQARLHGSSRVGTFGLIHLAVTALLSFSSAPIRLVSFFGLLCAASSLAAGLAFIGVKVFTNAAIPGWASMMTAIAFASGIQLLCLGLIGEYIARIYDEVKQRPLYMVGAVWGASATEARAAGGSRR
jgi:polyisoprenyl-phosphate glycosyltransferase